MAQGKKISNAIPVGSIESAVIDGDYAIISSADID